MTNKTPPISSDEIKRQGFFLYVGLGTLLITLLIIFAFFTAYNRFLVDRSTEMLENSLSQVAYAQTVEDMKTLKFFLDELLVSELSEKSFDAKQLSGIEFSKSIVFEAKNFRQIRDIKMILEDVLDTRQKKKSEWARLCHDAVETVKSWIGRGKRPEAGVGLRRKGRDLTPEEQEFYDQARKDDEEWKLPAAIRAYEQLAQKAENYREIAYVKCDLAYAHMKMGRFDLAKSVLLNVKEEYPGGKEESVAEVLLANLNERSSMKASLEQLQSEIKGARNAQELQQLYFKIALLDYKLFDLSGAEEAFRNSAAVIPGNEHAMKALFYLGLALKFHAKYEEAAGVFQTLVDKFPQSSFAVYGRYQLADSFHKIGNYEQSAKEFEYLAFTYPQSDVAALSQFRVGYTYYYDLKNPVLAARAFDKFSQEFRDSRYGEYSKLEISPFLQNQFTEYGFELLSRRLYSDAKIAFEDAIRADPKDSWAYSGLATAQVLLGDKEGAMKTAERAIEITPDEYTIAVRGFVEELKENFPDAVKDYEKSLSLRRKYPAVLYNIARLKEFFGDYDSAIKYYQELIEVTSLNVKKTKPMPEAYNNLGHALWYKGRFLDAAEQFKKAIALRDNYLEAHYNLALAYEAVGKKELAEGSCQKALDLDPNFAPAKETLRKLREKK